MKHTMIAALFALTSLTSLGTGSTAEAGLRDTKYRVYYATQYTTAYKVMVEHYNGTTSSRGVFEHRWEAEIEVILAMNDSPYDSDLASANVAAAWIEEVEVPFRWSVYDTYESELIADWVVTMFQMQGDDAYYAPVLFVDGFQGLQFSGTLSR